MEIFELFKIDWIGAWWFTAAFGISNLYFIIKYPRSYSKRLFTFPNFASRWEKVTSIISMVLFMRGMMIYTVFIPVTIHTAWFYAGLIIFLAGLIFYLNAMKVYAETAENVPVVKGAYKITRHPMQNFSVMMWIGVGIAAADWIILLICCAQPFLSRWFLEAQERYCQDRYGRVYQEYLMRTPRYIFL